MAGPLSDLRDAVAAASGAIAGSGGHSSVAPTLERPKKAGFGDYATNAAMLLAPRAGVPPRDVAGRLADELERAPGRGPGARRGGGPGLPEPLHVRRLARRDARPRDRRGRRVRRRRRRSRRARERRVRLGQPDRSDDRRRRPPRGVRRFARAAARVQRPRRDARVLHQRHRRAGAPARRVDPGARARRGRARGRLRGRVRARARRAASPTPRPTIRSSSPSAACSSCSRGSARR